MKEKMNLGSSQTKEGAYIPLGWGIHTNPLRIHPDSQRQKHMINHMNNHMVQRVLIPFMPPAYTRTKAGEKPDENQT